MQWLIDRVLMRPTKLKLINQDFFIDDDGKVCFVVTPTNSCAPEVLLLEDVLEDQKLQNKIETKSLIYILEIFLKVRNTVLQNAL